MKTPDLLCRHRNLWTMANMMKEWDESLFCHSLDVANLTYDVACKIGLEEKQIEHLQLGAFLHDVGKVRWPRCLVFKRDLSPDDLMIIRDHPRYGFAYTLEYFQDIHPDVLRIIREHHEKPDGSGYPDGLKDGEISHLSRIVSAVECFVALTEPRKYRQNQYTADEALRMALADGHDTEALKAIENLFGKEEWREVIGIGL